MSTRSIFPTGGARTPRLAMPAADAISLYRFEKANAAARRYDSLEAERDTLAAAMARNVWSSGSKSKRNAKPHVPTACMCGCGLMCPKGRRTATRDCLRRVRAARPRCLHCKRPLGRKAHNQQFCTTATCQLARFRRSYAMRKSLTPNRKAS